MEVRITRTCKTIFAGLIAATLFGSPAYAKRGSGADMLNRYVEARLAESTKKPEAAAVIYAETLKASPDNALLAGKAYVKAIEAGDFALALRAVRTLELQNALNVEMPLLLFADGFARRDYKSAQLASIQLESLDNFSFMSPLLEAWLSTAIKQSPLSDLAKAKKNKTSAYYHEEQLILHALSRGHEAEIMQLINAMVDRNEARMAPVRILVARHFLAQKNMKQAAQILEQKRTGPEAKMLREILAGNGKKLAQKVTPQVGLGFLLQRLASDLGAQRAYFLGLVGAQTAYRIFPDSDYGQLILGEAYAQAGNNGAARAEFEKIPSDSAYALLANSMEVARFVEDKEFSQAQDRLGKVIDKRPNTPELHALSGQLLQASGDYSAAAQAYKKAIALAEKSDFSDALLANYWLSLGSAQERGGQWPAGLSSLKKADALRPNSASILNYLGYAQLERRENTEEAISAIRKAHKLRSSSPAITDSLGWAYYVTGEHEKAVGYLERARVGQPQDPTINEHLGDAYWSVGRKYEARYAWKSAKLFADAEDMGRLTKKIDLGLQADLVSP
ncbi:MAG: tetratricopeptide repeat protein [Parasphingorhabdus sp.]|uniref:tetratricopeptide repeat protein n=1 Tax=Parasphingorhabdus sp. TaxID=2709688 RepID=UPI00329694A4